MNSWQNHWGDYIQLKLGINLSEILYCWQILKILSFSCSYCNHTVVWTFVLTTQLLKIRPLLKGVPTSLKYWVLFELMCKTTVYKKGHHIIQIHNSSDLFIMILHFTFKTMFHHGYSLRTHWLLNSIQSKRTLDTTKV